MFPKTGKKFPVDVDSQTSTYVASIAEILKTELGNSHQAHKTLMRWTGANERTAKNWLSGSNGPSGEHLLHLMCNSDQVFEFVLRLSRRPACFHITDSQKFATLYKPQPICSRKSSNSKVGRTDRKGPLGASVPKTENGAWGVGQIIGL